MLVFLLVLLCCIFLCQAISRRWALRGLRYSCKPISSMVEPGESFELITTLVNDKWMPVSHLEVVQTLPCDIELQAYLGRFSGDPQVARLYSSCYLMPRQKLTRRIVASLPRRGRHFILDATLSAGDLLGLSHQSTEVNFFYEIVVLPPRIAAPQLSQALGGFLGQVSVRRFILEDPVLTIGAREYTGREPMKSISWKHTLRAGHLMVKNFDYTVESSVTIILNVDGEVDVATRENCFSLARMVVEQLEERGLQYAFLTNAATAGALGRWRAVAEGLGSGHSQAILEGLGRATHDVLEPLASLLRRAALASERGRAHVLVTPQPLATGDPRLRQLQEVSDGRLFVLCAQDLPDEEGRLVS